MNQIIKQKINSDNPNDIRENKSIGKKYLYFVLVLYFISRVIIEFKEGGVI